MTDAAPAPAAAPEPAAAGQAAERLPALPKRKMTLAQQTHFLRSVIDRCRMVDPQHRGAFAGETWVTLSLEDVAALACIEATLNLFDFHDAPGYVRAREERKRKAAAERGKR